MDKKIATTRAANKAKHDGDYNTEKLRFGNDYGGVMQRRIIRYLLGLYQNGLDNMPELERLERAGTDAIRALCHPYKNPIHPIHQLRWANGDACLLCIRVDAARLSPHGKAPGYYWIPLEYRQRWRDALGGAV